MIQQKNKIPVQAFDPFFSRLLILTLWLALAGTAFAQGSPNIIWQQRGDSDRINSVIFTPSGNTLISGSSDRLINFWQASDGTLLRTLNIGAPSRHESSIESLAISPNGQTLAAGTFNYIQLFDLPTGAERKIPASSTWIVGVAISPDGQYVVSASFDHTVKIFRIWDGALIRNLTGHGEIVRAVAFSPDGSLLASCSDDRTIRLWRTADWALVRVISSPNGHTDDLFSLAFSPDGTTVASGSYDHTAKVWNVADGSLKYTFGGSGNVYGVAYTPNGAWLALTDGEGGHIKAFRLSDGAQVRSYDVNNAQCLAFSSAGVLGYGITDQTVFAATLSGAAAQPSPASQGFALQQNIFGDGGIQANPPPNAAGGTYLPGTAVSLTAVPGNSGFIRWDGAANSTARTISISMDSDKTISAQFAPSFTTIYWQNYNGQLAVWNMNGTGLANSTTLNQRIAGGWRMAGQADFNGDGQVDFLWQHDDGRLAVWFMDGTTFAGSVLLRNGERIPYGWRLVGLSDFNNDGSVDFLWQHNDGRLAVWFMDGINFNSSILLRGGARIPAGWHVKAMGDFNNDGQKDILWQQDNGRIAVWYMNGTDLVNSAYLFGGRSVSSIWQIAGVNDFDGDGHIDILWQHANGPSIIWFMNNTDVLGNVFLAAGQSVPSNWRIVGPK